MNLSQRSYLDYNATAPMLDCAREAAIDAFAFGGNASSVHFEGRAARKTIEEARRRVAELVGANPANVIFTSGATEAASHALCPRIRVGGHEVAVSTLYCSASEHPCILAGGRFARNHIEVIPVLKTGLVDLQALETMLEAHDDAAGLPMVAVQLANNETGVIQPVSQIAELVHAHDGIFVVDAVQALGKYLFNLAATGADMLILSSHKIGGPQGCGALVLASGSQSPIPLIPGGGQENYHRGGTENVPAIAGFGAACQWHFENLTKNIQKYALRDSIEEGICTISREAGNDVSQPVFFGKTAPRLGNTSCFAVPGVRSETALVALDLDGISVSSGSACSSGKVKQSHVLQAMAASPGEMEGALRVSVGWDTTHEDADRFLAAWKTIIGRMAA